MLQLPPDFLIPFLIVIDVWRSELCSSPVLHTRFGDRLFDDSPAFSMFSEFLVPGRGLREAKWFESSAWSGFNLIFSGVIGSSPGRGLEFTIYVIV